MFLKTSDKKKMLGWLLLCVFLSVSLPFVLLLVFVVCVGWTTDLILLPLCHRASHVLLIQLQLISSSRSFSIKLCFTHTPLFVIVSSVVTILCQSNSFGKTFEGFLNSCLTIHLVFSLQPCLPCSTFTRLFPCSRRPSWRFCQTPQAWLVFCSS